MIDLLVVLAGCAVLAIVLLNVTRRARVVTATMFAGAGVLVLFALPGGGADNPVPFLIAMACAAIVIAAVVGEAINFGYRKLVRSRGHG